MSNKRLITSALPYVNNAPHLGNIIGAVLSADVFARYCRSAGYETLYICGTDGYGTATETKAREEKTTPAEICERYHEIHAKVYQDFNISFDAFGRTFQDGHTSTVQSMFRDVSQNGFALAQDSEQIWCGSCEKFLADRLVNGECPNCQYADCRGDQCDSCGKLLNPIDLVNPRCSVCAATPVVKSARHLYLDLPKLNDRLVAWQEKAISSGSWTRNAITTTRSWIERGLNPRPISRDLKWGVKVPEPGFTDKVFYVWFDAPIGYISITQKFFPDSWKDWWMDPDNVSLYQFMGKDNIPFHSVIFPATQLASGRDWTMVHQINSTEYLNYEDEKFSKSRNIGVFGTDVAKIGMPIDFWRYYLLRIRPERQDSAFSWDDLFDRVNNELIDNVCNLVNRILVYNNKNFHGTYETPAYQACHLELIDMVKSVQEKYLSKMERGDLKDGLDLAMQVGKIGNKFFQDQAPWVRIKSDPTEVRSTILCLIHLVRDIGVMLLPFVPETSKEILAMIGSSQSKISDLGCFDNLVGKSQTDVKILHKKLDTKKISTYKAAYGGSDKTTFEDLDIQVGVVESCEKISGSKSLFVEQVKILRGKSLQIVSGLAAHYQAEDLIGKKVAVLVNLPATEIKGVNSEGMLLVAATRSKMELLNVEGAALGARFHREGAEVKESLPEVCFDQFLEVKMTIEKNVVVVNGQTVLVNNQPVKTERVESGKVK